MARPDPRWWDTAVVYQVYPRSFADSDGDGVGDLAGVTSRLDHLAGLGIDAIWLSPFYPSPLADGGYDIVDHRAVDPRLGTLDDVDDLIAAAHRRGIRLIVDIVPNHTSDQHPWFREALASPAGSSARDRYIFRDGRGEEPPSDWRSHFGGSAWERVGDGQWYCHLFAREQPDLDWSNPEVREHFHGVIRFWADRGVDGFRVDAAHTLAKDLTEPLRSQPRLSRALPLDGTDPLYDRDEVHSIFEGWRAVFDEYDPPRMAVAETWSPRNERSYLYARPTELGQVFDFSLLKARWGLEEFRRVIEDSLSGHRAAGLLPTWVLSNHDVPRHASRLALDPDADPDAWLLSGGTAPRIDPERGARRARAATLLMLALPGSAYLYQGEELGLPKVADLPTAVLQDPVWFRSGGTVKGRDGCRVPLPWTRTGPSLGFGTGGSWLPQPPGFGRLSVAAQEGVSGSSLTLYREALRLRRRFDAADPRIEWHDGEPGMLRLVRADGLCCVVNFASEPRPLPPGELLLASAPVEAGHLPSESAAWLLRQRSTA